MSDLIKQAEQNCVNIAKDFEAMFKILDAMATFGNRYTKEHIGKRRYFEGLGMMKDAVRHEFAEAITNVFMFCGVGGEAANAYALKKFKERFDPKERCEIMALLDECGQVPGAYKCADEEAFRKEGEALL